MDVTLGEHIATATGDGGIERPSNQTEESGHLHDTSTDPTQDVNHLAPDTPQDFQVSVKGPTVQIGDLEVRKDSLAVLLITAHIVASTQGVYN